jgi:hypothetical protein
VTGNSPKAKLASHSLTKLASHSHKFSEGGGRFFFNFYSFFNFFKVFFEGMMGAVFPPYR